MDVQVRERLSRRLATIDANVVAICMKLGFQMPYCPLQGNIEIVEFYRGHLMNLLYVSLRNNEQMPLSERKIIRDHKEIHTFKYV